MKWRESQTLQENASRTLLKLIDGYFKSGEKAMQRGVSWKALHNFRLDTKRFRYTLELFRSLYGKAFEQRLDSLRQLQTLMGDINDCIAAQDLLKHTAEAEVMEPRLERRARRKLTELRHYWRDEFNKAGELEQWRKCVSPSA